MVEKELKKDRSYVRAKMFFKVKYRVLTPEEYKVEKEICYNKSFAEKSKMQGVDESAGAGETAPDQCLVQFLLKIDEKLDRILTLLSRDEKDMEGFNDGTGLDIGGDGMKLAVDNPVDLGQIIHINFVLSKFEFIHLDLFGEVVYVKSVDAAGKKVYHTGVNFLELDETDREKIIARVFQKQREDIRQTHAMENRD